LILKSSDILSTCKVVHLCVCSQNDLVVESRKVESR